MWNQYIEINPLPIKTVRIPIKQFGIKKLVIVRTKGNGGL